MNNTKRRSKIRLTTVYDMTVENNTNNDSVMNFGKPPQKYNVARMHARQILRKWRYQSSNYIGSIFFICKSGIKRGLDAVFSAIFLICLSPIFLLTGLAIKIEDPGPVFFAQVRVGKWGKLFKMYKFRSMVVNADKLKSELLDHNETGGVIFKMKEDPRITRVGKFIRKYSIDELPQFINVLKGNMSLVGPRPPVPAEVSEYTMPDRKRLEVKPGITCIWQVSGRSEIDFDGQVKLDVQYIRNQSFISDVKLLIKTIFDVLLGKGAY
jgi:exopolysaccharide biosynthesis polyprenyl glycosylphosphotransferase